MADAKNYKEKAINLLKNWKKENYAFGIDCLGKVGDFAREEGKSCMLVVTGWGEEKWIEVFVDEITSFLKEKKVTILDIIAGARANAPREDVYRIANQIGKKKPDSIIAVGGGSTIDAVKAAAVLSTLASDDIETYFGMGLVTERLTDEGTKLPPVIAVQTAASSGAHLTKYSNITDPLTGQKKLIVDEAIVPPRAVFDYRTTVASPYTITTDGALDGIAHCLEVVYGATGKAFFDEAMQIAKAGISLIVDNLPSVIDNPKDEKARVAIGLGTDLGGYAIMVGGTNYAHLFSFSVVNKLTHGRACAIVNPYATVFFAPVMEKQLLMVANILKRAGYIKEDAGNYRGKDLGILVAEGMIALSRKINFPTTFSEVGVDDEDKQRILTSAKNPQLWSKLEQAPVSLIAKDKTGGIDAKRTEENIDIYMGALLDAIMSGDFHKIKIMPA
ncbi:iron-containing alcohol dehydrogenase [Candidatus Aerophobetes bacterium]|nr:iron-containing alcohol dehydrogenase [Candidatus Aerophobetes bacterium]